MKSLLVIGPDSTLRNVHAIAVQAYPGLDVRMLPIPSVGYYDFDLSGLNDFPPSNWNICVAVNEFYINDVRRALCVAVEPLGYEFQSVISPRADIDPLAVIGDNSIIYSGCVVGANTRLGRSCVLRANVVLCEDVTLGDFVTLEANVAVREGAVIGDFTTVCANSSLMRFSRIGKHCCLNKQLQYDGVIKDWTWYEPNFQHPVRVLGAIR